MGCSGAPRAARVGVHRGRVPRHCMPSTVPGRGPGMCSPDPDWKDGLKAPPRTYARWAMPWSVSWTRHLTARERVPRRGTTQRARPCSPVTRWTVRIGLPVGHPVRLPGRTRCLAAINRVLLSIRGRPPSLGRAHLHPPAPRGRAKTATPRVTQLEAGTGARKRPDVEPLVSVIGDRAETGKGSASWKANRWRAECPINLNTA